MSGHLQEHYHPYIKTCHEGAAEMTQWLRALHALTDDHGQLPAPVWWITTPVPEDLMFSLAPRITVYTWCLASDTYTHRNRSK